MIQPKRAAGYRTRARILEAAKALLAHHNSSEVSLTAIAREAGISTGTFYRRFANKEALLHYLHKLSVEEDLAHFRRDYSAEALTGKSLEASLALMIDTALSEGTSTGGFQRAAMERTFSDEDFRSREALLHHAWAECFHDCILRHRHRVRHPEPERAADFCARMVVAVGVQRNQLEQLEPEVIAKTDAELGRELLECCLRYLQVTPEAGGA